MSTWRITGLTPLHYIRLLHTSFFFLFFYLFSRFIFPHTFHFIYQFILYFHFYYIILFIYLFFTLFFIYFAIYYYSFNDEDRTKIFHYFIASLTEPLIKVKRLLFIASITAYFNIYLYESFIFM